MLVPKSEDALAAVKALAGEVEAKAETLAREASGMVINDEKTLAAAGNMKATISMTRRMMESRLRDAFAPLKTFEKSVRGLLAPANEKLEKTEEAMRNIITAAVAVQEREARKAAEKENARLAKQYAKDAAKAEKKGEDAPPAPARAEVVVKAQAGATQIRKVWDFRVVDVQNIAPQFLEVKRGPLLAALAALEAEGHISGDATDEKPVDVLGVRAYKRVSV